MARTIRRMLLAGKWYPATEKECRRDIERYRRQRPPFTGLEGKAAGAVAPHAGWVYSGPVAAATLRTLAGNCGPVETVLCFGAVHVPGVAVPAVFPEGAWETPFGPAEVDAELAAELLRRGGRKIAADIEPHLSEHSIEVQLPFIRETFPRARILPVACPPGPESSELGRLAADAARELGRNAVGLGSTDLTHYGLEFFGWAPAGEGEQALRWVKEENDPPVIAAMESLDAEAVLKVAQARRNACGAGAVAAAVSFARARGARRGYTVDYATSCDTEHNASGGNFVAYVGVVFAGGAA